MMTCASASAGVFVDMYTWFQAGFLSAIVGAGLMLMLIATPDTGKNTIQRLGYLLGFGLTSGKIYSLIIICINMKVLCMYTETEFQQRLIYTYHVKNYNMQPICM